MDTAKALYAIVLDLHHGLMWGHGRSAADRLTLIDVTVEVVNKMLHAFAVAPSMPDQVDRFLNQPYITFQPRPNQINRMYCRCVTVVRALLSTLCRWVSSMSPASQRT